MELRHQVELTLVFLAAAMVYLTYSPVDETYFWIYWFVVLMFMFFMYLFDILFANDMSFVFDPNADNWRRKVDPQS